MKRRILACAALAAGFVAAPLSAQRNLAAGVRAFVEVEDSVVALVGVRLIDGSGAPAQANQTVLIRGNRIAAVGPAGSVPVPAGARTLSLGGHTVIPGYVMLHEHMFYGVGSGAQRAYNQMEFSFPKLYLAGGVTTMRTGGTRDPYGDLNLRDEIEGGRLVGPRIDVTAPYITGPGYPVRFLNTVKDAEDARRVARYWMDEGTTSIKVYQHITRDELRATIEEAHARGQKVTGHICSVTYREAADLGIDDLEHGFRQISDFVPGRQPDQCDEAGRSRWLAGRDINGPEMRALLKHLIDKGVAVTSTMVVFEAGTPGRPMAPQGVLDAMSGPIRDQYIRAWAAVQQQKDSPNPKILRDEMALQKSFFDQGGLLVAGIDPTSGTGQVVAGFSNQRQVELLREAGLTSEQAIQVATSNGAKYLGVLNERGTVQVGKLADLVVLEGDAAADITAVRNVRLVFKDGIGYDPVRLRKAAEGAVGLY